MSAHHCMTVFHANRIRIQNKNATQPYGFVIHIVYIAITHWRYVSSHVRYVLLVYVRLVWDNGVLLYASQ